MKSYRTTLKADVLMQHGIVDSDVVSTTTSLDAILIQLALRTLPKTERCVFFFLFHCTPTWDDLQVLLLERLDREYDRATVQTYARRSSSNVLAAASNSPAIRQWLKAFLEARTKAHTASKPPVN